jgi:hypothetical protein
MNVVQFKFNKFLEKDPFCINDTIEQIYIEIAEMVFNRIYKAYCFNPLFEGVGTAEEQQESVKSAIMVWADCFMDWKINSHEKAKEATNYLISMNIYPTLGLFRAVYFNEQAIIDEHIYKEYINYLYRLCFYGKDGKIHGADYFTDWNRERINANQDTC